MSIEELKDLVAKRNKGKAAPSEHDLQVACIQWFKWMYRDFSDLLFSIPNGAKRTKWERRQALAEGLRHGVPDMFLAVPRNGKHGLWIEMKNGKAGRLSDYQKEMIVLLQSQGYCCAVCRTMDEFINAVGEYMCEDYLS